VNFWRPGGKVEFKGLSPGDLFLFRLKSPTDKIAGGGVFVHTSMFPIGLAWQAFGEKNGARSEAEFLDRIAKYRNLESRQSLDPDSRIGCIILQAPFFLPPERWIDVPSDYHRNLTQGRRFGGDEASGKYLVAAVSNALKKQAIVSEPDPASMFGSPTLVKHRLGQGSFRVLVTDNYERRCAVTGEKTLPVLEAAHIFPVKRGGQHRSDNGILLRSDLHTLFDLGYVTVTPDFRFHVSKALRDEYSNGHVYYELEGRDVRLPAVMTDRPDRGFLEWHRDSLFRK